MGNRFYRTISTIVLICFLFNSTVYDIPLTSPVSNHTFSIDKLATPSMFSRITGIQPKDQGRVKAEVQMLLSARLRDFDNSQLDQFDEETLSRILSAENHVIWRGASTIFTSSIRMIPGSRNLHVRFNLPQDDYSRNPRSYYAVFPLAKDEDGGFPVHVYTEEEFEQFRQLGMLTGDLPDRRSAQPEVAESIDRYAEHEINVDKFLKEKAGQSDAHLICDDQTMAASFLSPTTVRLKVRHMAESGTFPMPDTTVFNLEEELAKLGIPSENILSITNAIQERQLIFVHARPDERPVIQMKDKDGTPHKIRVDSHTSNKNLWIMLNDKEWEQMKKIQEAVHKPDIQASYRLEKQECADFIKTANDRLVYESGVICGLEGFAERDLFTPDTIRSTNALTGLRNLLQYETPSPERDEREADLRAQLVDLKPVNLDTNLLTRDYAQANDIEKPVATASRYVPPDEAKSDIDRLVPFDGVFGNDADNSELRKIYDRIVSKINEVSGELDERYAEESIRTEGPPQIIQSGKQDYTLVVNIRPGDDDKKVRKIGIYESYIRGLYRLIQLIDESKPNAYIQDELIDAIIEASVLHELGHGFEDCSGLDIYTLITDSDVRNEFAGMLGIAEVPDDTMWKFVEAVADLHIGGKGNKNYARNKAAYLFYKYFSLDPGKYMDEHGNARGPIVESDVSAYYAGNPYLEEVLIDEETIASVAIQVQIDLCLFFGRGTAWQQTDTRQRALAPDEEEDDDADERTSELRPLVRRTFADAKSVREAARDDIRGLNSDDLTLCLGIIRSELPSLTGSPSRMIRTTRQIITQILSLRGVTVRQGHGEKPIRSTGITSTEIVARIDGRLQSMGPTPAGASQREIDSTTAIREILLELRAILIANPDILYIPLRIGAFSETKQGERRTGLTPDIVYLLTILGLQVTVQKGTGTADGGNGSRFYNGSYERSGARLVDTAQEVFERADIFQHIKELQTSPDEEALFAEVVEKFGERILYTFNHFANSQDRTARAAKTKGRFVSFENVLANGRKPILRGPSEKAGVNAAYQMAMYLLTWEGRNQYNQNKEELEEMIDSALSNYDETNEPEPLPVTLSGNKVVVYGGGVVGYNQARMLATMNANVTVIERRASRIQWLKDQFIQEGLEINVISSNDEDAVIASLQAAHGISTTAYIQGTRAQHLIPKSLLSIIGRGKIFTVVDIDQGGGIEGAHATSHEDPVYASHGNLYYCVPNIPGAIPRQTSIDVSLGAAKYLAVMALYGLEKAVDIYPELGYAVDVADGRISNPIIQQEFPSIEGGVKLERNPEEMTPLEKELSVARARVDAKESAEGNEEMASIPTNKYSLLVDHSLFKDTELEEDIDGYRLPDGRYLGAKHRFNLHKVDTSNVENILQNIQAHVKNPENAIVQISYDLSTDDLKKLTDIGVRVIKVDTSDFKYDRELNEQARLECRFDLYALMLAARRITEKDRMERNSVYRTLSFFLNSHYKSGTQDIASTYIHALIGNQLDIIVKYNLSYKPAIPWKIPSYHSVSATLISA